MEKFQFEWFKHFLVCYFNISMDFSDLKNVLTFYKNTETENTRNELLAEVNILIKMNDIDYVQQLFKEHGMRNLSKERLIEMIITIKSMLS